MSMAKNRNIDLGIPTEDLPEWTIDLDFVEKEKEEKEKEKITTVNETVSASVNSGSALASEFNSEFVLDGSITSPLNENVGGLESEFNSFNNTANISAGGAGDSILESPATPSIDESISSLGTDTVPVSGVQDLGERDTLLGNSSLTEPENSTVSESINIPVEKDLTHEQGEMEKVSNEQNEEADITEKDEVEEKLNHLANSMHDWEQSENALSEAAAMLSVEAESEISSETTNNNNEDKELKNLFERLDISENLDRINAAVQEDIADVIEQTEKDNDLFEAVNAMPEQTEAEDLPDHPEPVMDDESSPVIDMMLQKEETLNSAEEKVIPQDITISNDMFDIGIDLSEDENFSDENIDLSEFKGSIKDADEFSTDKDNSIDLDAAEADMENGGMAELDMSNLVAAAMSNLNGESGNEVEDDYSGFSSDEPEISADIQLPEEPEEEQESTLEFMTGAEPEEEQDLNSGTMDDFGLEFVTEDEPEVEEEPEEIKLEFEPAYPEGNAPVLSGIMESTEDNIDSLIIEDYSEVPTVSDLENKLKKQEKEKKRHKSKESHKNKEDGFAFSLDDLEAAEKKDATGHETEPEPIRNFVVDAALEVAEQTAAAQEKEEETVEQQVKRIVIGQHVVHKSGMSKRSYYRLIYKDE